MIILYIAIFGQRIYGQFTKGSLKYERENCIIFGKPDRIVKKGGQTVIYEYKTRKAPPKPYGDHIMQIGTYFLLFENTYRKRADFGIIKYKDREFRIENSSGLREQVLNKIDLFIKETEDPENILRNHNNYGKCHNCQYKALCASFLGKRDID